MRYEGSFKNGMKDGFGREFGGDGDLWFQGQFKNDKKNGMIIEYDQEDDTIIKYEG